MIVRDGTELRSPGITTMEDANRFLKEVYLPDHNARFVKVPEDEASAFVPFTGNARDTLCVQEDRVVGNDNTVRYKGLVLQIAANRHRHHFVKAKVRVHEYPDGDRDALAATSLTDYPSSRRRANRKPRDPLQRGANAAAQIYARLRLPSIWAAALSTEADNWHGTWTIQNVFDID